MRWYSTYRQSLIVISVIVLIVFLSTKCIDKQKSDTAVQTETPAGKPKADWNQFVGSAACESCHISIYESHRNTAHYHTSAISTADNIHGSFDKGKNSIVFSDRVKVVMEKRGDGFYQAAYLNGEENQNRRIDIVIGSGTKGQSYLNWMQNRLFQLPITYFTAAHQWSNSPGYPGKVVFNRPITSRCLECHSTYVQKISSAEMEPEEFDQTRILYGVDCEKCHGPAASHVEYQTKNPTDTLGKYIVNPGLLTRQQNLDLCALCHGGRLSKTKPSFGFEAGDKLTDYFILDTATRRAADIDVHGNQAGLLAASKCFRMSQMTCSSCHNAHENEKGKVAVISKRCMNCHNNEHGTLCKMNDVIGTVINKNCIDCHMPKQSSRSIAVMLQGESVPAAVLMRTHLIKIYPDETEKVLNTMKWKVAIPAK